VVIRAWNHLQRMKLDAAALAELPIAYLHSTTLNLNRDESKRREPFLPADVALFQREQKASNGEGLSPQVAAVALSLQREGQAPPILLAAWPEILKASKPDVQPPSLRCLRSDDGVVWVLAPRMEGKNVRGGLVCVGKPLHGPVRVRDMDRPLLHYDLTVPNRYAAAWLEGDLLLMAS
jgi:hypothetical protein